MDREIERKIGIPPWGTRLLFRPGISFIAEQRHSLDFEQITPLRAVPEIAPRPILFIHGGEDTRIPTDHSRRLKAVAQGPADDMWILAGRGHTEGVRLQGNGCGPSAGSPIRAQYLSRAIGFFDVSLR